MSQMQTSSGARRGTKSGYRKTFRKRKVCRFCSDKKILIDYKDSRMLRPFVTGRGKILSMRITGTCAGHQREVTLAIKRARHIAILPFIAVSL